MTAKLKDGRKWTVDATGGITGLSRRYVLVRDSIPAGTPDEEIVQAAGLPALGSAHSAKHSALYCVGYSFEEGTEGGKRVLYCDVQYSQYSTEASESNKPPRGQAVEAHGWKSGFVQRDMLKDAQTGKALLNTAGQPFDSVPQIEIPAPVFTKVLKTKARQGSWPSFQGKVNSGAMTVGGVSCAKHALRCVQLDCERLWGDEFGYLYRYTIGLQLMQNKAVIEGGSEQDIGWDLAIVSAGTMELRDGADVATPIKVVSAETGKEVFVTNPVLLDKDGKAMLERGAEPYALRFSPYQEASFPGEFYSEPA
jgi:hypothetical protein